MCVLEIYTINISTQTTERGFANAQKITDIKIPDFAQIVLFVFWIANPYPPAAA